MPLLHTLSMYVSFLVTVSSEWGFLQPLVSWDYGNTIFITVRLEQVLLSCSGILWRQSKRESRIKLVLSLCKLCWPRYESRVDCSVVLILGVLEFDVG